MSEKNCYFLSVDSRMNDGIEGCFEPTLFIKQCSSNVWNFVQVAQSYAINLLIITRVSLFF